MAVVPTAATLLPDRIAASAVPESSSFDDEKVFSPRVRTDRGDGVCGNIGSAFTPRSIEPDNGRNRSMLLMHPEDRTFVMPDAGVSTRR